MRSNTPLQFILIVLVGGLVAALFYAGKNTPFGTADAPADATVTEGGSSGWEEEIDLVIAEQRKAVVDSALLVAYSELDSIATPEAYIKVAERWNALGNYLAAGRLYGLAAGLKPSEGTYLQAGDLYLKAQEMVEDSSVFQYLGGQAAYSYEQVLAIDEANLNAKAGLAVAYLETGLRPPMVAIGLLREVVQVDSNHQRGLFYLGYFSMMSGQYQKGVERFSKLTGLYPESPQYHEYLGEAFAKLGDKAAASASYKLALSLYEEEVEKQRLRQLLDRLSE